jgi:hypothetical protein
MTTEQADVLLSRLTDISFLLFFIFIAICAKRMR